MNKAMLVFSLLLLALFVTFCEKSKDPVSSDEIDYSNITDIKYTEHVQALFNKECTGCHNSQQPEAGLRLDSWVYVVKGSETAGSVIPFDSRRSRMIEMLTKLQVGGQVKPHPSDQGRAALDTARINFLARWIDQGAKNDAGEVPFEHSHENLYVCNQNAALISIVDPHAFIVTRNIDLQDLGYPANSQPHFITLSPDGEFWYASLIGVNKVLKFDAHDNELLGEAATPVPAILGHHPVDNVLYISRFMDPANPQNSIYAVDSETMQPAAGSNNGNITLPASDIYHGLSLDSNYVYTTSLTRGEVIVISHANKEFVTALPLGTNRQPLHTGLSPDHHTLYVSCIGTDEIAVIDVTDPENPVATDFIAVGDGPWHPHLSHEGEHLYVGNNGSDNFSVIDTHTNSVQFFGLGNGSDGLSSPHGLAVVDHNLYLSNRNNTGHYVPKYDFGDNHLAGTVVKIHPTTYAIEKVLEVEEFPTGLAIYHGHE